ncbi:MAG: hypothetical protein ACREQ3_09770 [Candidatus Binatia bacterium]
MDAGDIDFTDSLMKNLDIPPILQGEIERQALANRQKPWEYIKQIVQREVTLVHFREKHGRNAGSIREAADDFFGP